MKPILYLSFDIESDGPNVLVNNMLSFGICGITQFEEEIFTFAANLEELEGHSPAPECMSHFWHLFPEAWNATQLNKRPFVSVFKELATLLTSLKQTYRLVFAAMPACFDWMFFKTYYDLARMTDNTIVFDIGFHCNCMSTLFTVYKKQNKLTNKQMDEFKNSLLREDSTQLHNALYDAHLQGVQYVKLLTLMELH